MILLLVACGGADSAAPAPDPDTGTPPAGGPPAPVTGRAYAFDSNFGSIAGGTVAVVERPELTTTTLEDGSYTLEIPSGTRATLTLTHPEFVASQTATLEVPTEGLAGVDFQGPSPEMVDLLAAFAGVELDPTRCQIASTVIRPEGAIYAIEDAQGEPGAEVHIAPSLPSAQGPIYFQIAAADLIWPDPSLTATTEDGGVLFVNVPEGDYTLTAEKAGMSFTPRDLMCRPGWVVNAAPPWGLQAE